MKYLVLTINLLVTLWALSLAVIIPIKHTSLLGFIVGCMAGVVGGIGAAVLLLVWPKRPKSLGSWSIPPSEVER